MMNPVTKPAGLLLTAFALTACNPQAQDKERQPPLVKVEPVQQITASPRMQFPAVAAAADRSELSFRVAGEVVEVSVKPGQQVVKGQQLARLDATDYQLAVDDAKARYELAQSQFSRAAKLVKTGSLAQSQLDELKAQRDIAKAILDLARLRLKFTTLNAPFDGIISKVPIEKFEITGAGQTVMNIHKLSDVDIRIQAADILYVKHSDRQAVETTQSIDPRVRLATGEEYPLTLKEFTAEPDPSSGAFMVTLTMPMPEDRLILDGMSVNVNVSGEGLAAYSAGAVEIPVEAVFNQDGDSLDATEKYVWVVGDDKRVSKRRIVTEKFMPQSIRVLDGLSAGELLVTAGVNKLVDGQLVRVKGGDQ
ncbi:efflux RND transporter periplasmic adaptor subunit [Shewanella corallii]|uniref:Efflux RND transporter periplasmic adaptor subunit n=1 Tax=Shewanella corallii TaxID=560080 RepID=A0ABT0N1Y8_9GAMM|nr:efflux RND transporter periplasmic adaptor subunit [Shewanella corallii]MCL2912428.1 efflux RND transporter periplasmic adaptor subunit [Shewanella corallii]